MVSSHVACSYQTQRRVTCVQPPLYPTSVDLIQDKEGVLISEVWGNKRYSFEYMS